MILFEQGPDSEEEIIIIVKKRKGPKKMQNYYSVELLINHEYLRVVGWLTHWGAAVSWCWK